MVEDNAPIEWRATFELYLWCFHNYFFFVLHQSGPRIRAANTHCPYRFGGGCCAEPLLYLTPEVSSVLRLLLDCCVRPSPIYFLFHSNPATPTAARISLRMAK